MSIPIFPMISSSLAERLGLLALALTLLPALAPTARAEAPQALGVIAIAEPDPMVCRDGECRVLVTSFCLEEHRRAPARGTAYAPAPGTEITVVLTAADGSRLSLPVEEVGEIRAGRHYTLTEIVIPQARLEELGAVAAAITIGPQATIIPKPAFRLGEPHSEADVALLSGPVRKAAGVYFDGVDGAGATAQLLAELIGEMPAIGRADAGLRQAAWNRMKGRAERAGVAPQAVEEAGQAFRDCTDLTDRKVIAAEATCLGWQHRDLQLRTNAEFWNSLGGS